MIKKNYFLTLLVLFSFCISFSQQVALNWMKQIGLAGYSFDGVSLVIDSNKSVIVAGHFRGTPDFDAGPGIFNLTSNGDQDLFIMEYDSSGNFHWAKHIGGLQGDQVRKMKFDNKGNIVILGMYQGTVDMDPGPGTVNVTSLGSDAFVIKLDNNGNYIWSKQWQVYSINTLEIDVNNNILLGGDFGGPADFDPGPGVYTMTGGNIYNDFFIFKIDENGNFKWAKQMPNQNTASMQELTMESDSKGAIYLGGNFTQSVDFDPSVGTAVLSSNGDNDGVVVKLDSNGLFSWVKQFGGAATDKVWSIEIDNADNILLTGQYNGTVDFDPGTAVFNLTNASNRGCFIVKLNNAGNLIFAKTFSGEAFGECITFDAGNNIYISGGFYNTVDFDPGQAIHSLTEGNIFITKLSEAGDYVWASQFQNAILGSYESIYVTIQVDVLKNIYYTGDFPFAVDFDPGPLTNIVTPYGSVDVALVKLTGGCRTPYTNITTTACGSYTLNGNTYTNSGVYYQNLISTGGCDSTLVIDLTITKILTPQNVSACGEYFFNGNIISSSGVYYDTLTAAGGCDSIVELTLNIFPKPSPQLGKDTSICNGQLLSLNPGNFNNYVWNDGTSGNVLGITAPGIYWVDVTDNNSCVSRDSITVSSGINCNNGICALTTETKLFPNPFGSRLIINKNITSCVIKMNLYNSIGQLIIKDYVLIDGVNDIDFSKFSSGVYFYKFHTSNQILQTGKLVKMNY